MFSKLNCMGVHMESCVSLSDCASKSLDDAPFHCKQHCIQTSIFEPQHEEAAVKLQMVYKSFRTRRKLADCAVIVDQTCRWKLLDFTDLTHSSISFFHIDKHESAVSRWSRALMRAAKVGKGLSKNDKARKLALQHWLEAIDPKHRYGHNLHFYHVNWLNSQSKEPFFYWLDIGEGKEVNIIEKCTRSKLQQQSIKYLDPMERKAYEIVIEDGKLFYKDTEELLETLKEGKGTKWIFVLSASKDLYAGKKKKGSFHHSSFLAGEATLAAGRIVAEKGVLKAVWPHSGHYRPTPENFQDFISFLLENNVDVTDVKLLPTDEEGDDSSSKKTTVYLRSNSSENMFEEKDSYEMKENNSDPSPDKTTRPAFQIHNQSLEIRTIENVTLMPRNQTKEYKTTGESLKRNDEEIIREGHILPRNYSLKADLKSWKQLPGKGLQCHALEQLNLSPISSSDEGGLGLELHCGRRSRNHYL